MIAPAPRRSCQRGAIGVREKRGGGGKTAAPACPRKYVRTDRAQSFIQGAFSDYSEPSSARLVMGWLAHVVSGFWAASSTMWCM